MAPPSEETKLLASVRDEQKATELLLPTPGEEFWTLLQVAIPNIIVALASTVPGVLTTAKVGRSFTIVDLGGLTLANLLCNLGTLSLLNGLYSASDTLSPQAYGSNNKPELGYLAVRGIVGSAIILVPTVAVLVTQMPRLLEWAGQDAMATDRAWHWYQIYACSMPFYVFYNVTYKFLAAQQVLQPVTVVAVLSCGVVLPLALYCATTFYETAVAVVLFQAFEAVALLGYLIFWQPHDPGTWVTTDAGFWKQALAWKPMMEYMNLGLGGILASSEWIYWELLSLIPGTLGVLPLSIHAIPTQVITVYCMIPFGLSIALSIRLGATMAVSARRAKEIAVYTLLVGTLFFLVLIFFLYILRKHIFALFSVHPNILEGCEEIWLHVCIFSFHVSVFFLATGTCVGLGMQWVLGFSTVFAMFGLGLPSTYYLTVVREGGTLKTVWMTTWPPYLLLNMILFVAILRTDWEEVSRDIRQRKGSSTEPIGGQGLDVVSIT